MATELARIDGRHDRSILLAGGNIDLITAFLSGRKPTTIRAYRNDLQDFAAFLGQPSIESAVNLFLEGSAGQANHAALSYRSHLTARGLAPATIARRLAALRSVVKLARTLGKVSWTVEVESPTTEALRDTAGPGDKGWKSILDHAKAHAATGKPIGIRNLAIVRCLHDLGLRRAELCNINLSDLDADFGSVAILGKGRSETTRLTIPEPVKLALGAWVQIRGSEPGPLFLRLDRAAIVPGRLLPNGLYKMCGILGERAGLAKKLRPHGLRHAAITSVLDRNGGDIRSAAKFSRHKDIRMLSRYDDNRQDLAGRMAELIADA